MADIQLTRPAANQTQTVTSAADARFVLNFNTGEAKLSKSDNGENLILTFDDGAKIEVEGFYTTFDKDSLPTLNVGGQDITGEQLVAILGEDLMPAAGPSAGQAAAQGGRFRSFADADLNGGIDRLNGLDIGFDGAAQQDDSPEGYYALANERMAAGEVSPEPTPTPTPGPTPGPTPEPPAPRLIAQDDPHSAGVMKSLNVSNFIDLSNDTLGTVAATAIAGIGEQRNSLPTGVNAYYDPINNALNLTLDGKSLENALFPGGEAKPIIQDQINTARHVKPVGGSFEVDYTAQDATGAYTGTAKATFNGVNKGTMSGDNGEDVAWATGNTGSINTGNGQDLVVAASNSGTINGGAGSDNIYIGSSDGVVDGGANDDKINFSGTNTGTIYGGAGSDTITVYENAGKIDGGAGNDTIDVVEGSGDNTLSGGDGRDLLVLRGGSAYLDGGDNNDTLKVQGDDDEHAWNQPSSVDPDAIAANFALADANDGQYATLVGGAGDDTVKASDYSHHNVLYGDDTNNAVEGNDYIEIINYSHDNTVYGGAGSDTVRIMRYSYNNDVDGGEGGDRLHVQEQAHHNTLKGGAGNDTLIAEGRPSGSDNPIIESCVRGPAPANELYGGADDDELYAKGNAAGNTLDGGTGNDYLYAQNSAHHNTLDGGAGNDTIEVQGSGGNVLLGGLGQDALYGGSGADYLDGGSGSDSISGGGGNDIIVYDAGDKHINGGAGVDFVLSGDDTLTMADLLRGLGGGTKAENVEVLIKGADALNITSIEQMASKYGITVNGDTLELKNDKWTAQEGGSYTYTDGSADLTLEAEEASITVQLTTGG